MSKILFEKNTEPEMREVLRMLTDCSVMFQGYVLNSAKRRIRYIAIVEKNKVKHEQIKIYSQKIIDYDQK